MDEKENIFWRLSLENRLVALPLFCRFGDAARERVSGGIESEYREVGRVEVSSERDGRSAVDEEPLEAMTGTSCAESCEATEALDRTDDELKSWEMRRGTRVPGRDIVCSSWRI